MVSSPGSGRVRGNGDGRVHVLGSQLTDGSQPLGRGRGAGPGYRPTGRPAQGSGFNYYTDREDNRYKSERAEISSKLKHFATTI